MRLWRLKDQRKRKTGNVLKVGVMGTARGVGTTHLAVMLANYYANGCGRRTCLIELSGHKDYMKICDGANIEVSDIRHFSYKGIDFHVCDGTKNIANYMAGEYEVVVIDMASEKEETIEELKRCDVRLVTGTTDVWKLGRLKRLLSELENIRVRLCMFMGNPKEMRKLQKEYNVGVFQVPAEADPFVIQSKTMYILKGFLAELSER